LNQLQSLIPQGSASGLEDKSVSVNMITKPDLHISPEPIPEGLSKQGLWTVSKKG
jgi:hypothetical protein